MQNLPMMVTMIRAAIATVFISGCSGEIVSAQAPEAKALEATDAGTGDECEIHWTIEWPTYFGDRGPEFALVVGDAGVVEFCTQTDSGGGFYLCAPETL